MLNYSTNREIGVPAAFVQLQGSYASKL